MRNLLIAATLLFIPLAAYAFWSIELGTSFQTTNNLAMVANATAGTSSRTFSDHFDTVNLLEEEGSMDESQNPHWWLNSGAYFYTNGIGSTMHNRLPSISKWRLLYALDNPDGTEKGYAPQNIFRLVTKSKWLNFSQEIHFRVDKTNISNSADRNASNGLLLFNRYQDQDNLYYAGVRVDGYVVIKKKLRGTYYTMAYEPLFKGLYDPILRPNLIPLNEWIGVRSAVHNTSDGHVAISVFVDVGKTGKWVLVAKATDDGQYGGPAILSEGYAGIRTDFMDVSFDNYKITTL